MKGSLFATSLLAIAALAAAEAPLHGAEARFYFQIKEVTAAPGIDAAVKTSAADALKAELASRPEWASDIGAVADAPGQAGGDRSALAAELTRRSLRGFDVTVRIEDFKQEMKEPRPGGRLKQVAVSVRLAVIGATIPDAKFAFEGAGESTVEAEVAEKRLAADTDRASKAAMKSAVKQAVEQALVKLSAKPTPAPAGGKKPAKKKS
jgi:hypothetical protein